MNQEVLVLKKVSMKCSYFSNIASYFKRKFDFSLNVIFSKKYVDEYACEFSSFFSSILTPFAKYLSKLSSTLMNLVQFL